MGFPGDEISVVIPHAMATYTDHHQAYCDNWGCSDLPSEHEDPQGISISEILNHGSISFGRYAAEPLAWEKWSVFSHNRCQEELEKFKAPGLVAQKKAYFEEYYRRIRALKAAEAEAQKQETTHHPEPYQDDLTATTSAEDSINDTGSKEEEQTSVVTQIQFSDTETTFPNLSGDSIENKSEVAERQRSYSSSSNGEASVGYEADVSYSALDLAHSPEVASPEPVPQSDSSSEAAQQNGLVSDMGTVNLSSSKREDHAPVLKPKGTVASARNKAKLDCRTRNNVQKPSEKLKPSSQKKVAGNAGGKLQASRKTTPKPAGNMRPNSVSSHRPPPTKVPTGATVLHSSIARDKPVPSPSTIRSVQTMISLNPKVLPEKLTSRLPVNTLSRSAVQSTPKEITIKDGMRNVATENRSVRGGVARKSLDLTGCNMTPKGGQSEKLRPKAMSTTLPARNKSNQNSGIEFLHRSYDRGHQKEGKDQTNAGQRRYPKPALSSAPSIHKPPSPRPRKITPLQSAELMRNQREPREPRPKTPCWR